MADSQMTWARGNRLDLAQPVPRAFRCGEGSLRRAEGGKDVRVGRAGSSAGRGNLKFRRYWKLHRREARLLVTSLIAQRQRQFVRASGASGCACSFIRRVTLSLP